MGIFNKTKKTVTSADSKDAVVKMPKVKPAKAAKEKAPAKTAKINTKGMATTAAGAARADMNHGGVILRPRITEKATMQADAQNVFVFEIAQTANKVSVREAIQAIFKVTPIKVAIARNPDKKVFSRGKSGMVSGVKKAYVYFKKGDKVELV